MNVPLNLDGVTAGYAIGANIVHEISFDAPADRILTIVGPNGSGKSTLIKVLAGVLPVRRGRIRLGDRDITRLDAPGRVGAGVGYVPQEHNVFRNMTIKENLDVAVEFLPGGRKPKARAEVFSLFPDLEGRLKDIAGNLSGGQRQMLAFASALMADPKVLLLDEPSAGLSPKYVGEIFAAVRKVCEAGVTVIMVEQNTCEALKFSDIGVVLAGGAVRHVGPADGLSQDPDIHRLYLGGR